MAVLLRELLWPAAAGNVLWALFYLLIKEGWKQPCGREKILAILLIGAYLAEDWLFTAKQNGITSSPGFGWIEYPFLAAIVAFAIATQEYSFPENIIWSEIFLGLAFALAAIGHGCGFWTSTRPLSPPNWFTHLPWVDVSASAYTRDILVIINLLGIAILLAPRHCFGYSGCWHLSLAIGIPFALWCAANWNSAGLPQGEALMSSKFEYREAKSEDIAAITCLAKRLAEETEDRTLEKNTVKEGITEFVNPTSKSENAKTRIYVAVADSTEGENSPTIIGYLTIAGAEWSDWDNGMFLWLGSAYVLPQYRESGVVRALYEKAVEYAKTVKAVGLRAYVLENNDSAKKAQAAVGQKFDPNKKYIVTENLFRTIAPSGSE